MIMLQEVDLELAKRLVQRFMDFTFSVAACDLECTTPSLNR